MLRWVLILGVIALSCGVLAADDAKKTGASRVDFGAAQIHDKEPLHLWDDNSPEIKAYCRLLDTTLRTTPRALSAAARRDLGYQNWMDDIAQHRGDIVHVEGMLSHLRRLDPPPPLRPHLRSLYEAWIHDPIAEDVKPVCVMLLDLPRSLEVGENLRKPIAVDGYLFKNLRYRTAAGWRDAPLVIGHTPTLLKLPQAPSENERAAATIAALAAIPRPTDSLTLLHAATLSHSWPAERPAPKPAAKATRLDLEHLFVEDKKPIANWQSNSQEATAFVYVLGIAHKTSLDALAAGVNPTIAYVHMWEEPAKHRGEVVHIEGTMTRLLRYDPPSLSKKEGLAHLYEGWVFDSKHYGANPTCLVFTELPEGLQVGEKIRQEVVFDGFFFKRYRYKAGDGWRDAPVVIGRSPRLKDASAAGTLEEPLMHGTNMVLIFLSLVAGTLFLGLGLAFWYRRGDRHIRDRISDLNHRSFVDPSDAPPQTEPDTHRPEAFHSDN